MSGLRTAMGDRDKESGEACSIPRAMEAPMQTDGETQKVQSGSRIRPAVTCAHSRLIGDILTESGKRTGKVRCLECDTEFDDPHRGES